MTPRLIGYFLYYPFYLLPKYYLESSVSEISARHSFYFKRIAFGLSDIDLTLYNEEVATREERESLVTKVSFMQKINPILGEINYFEMEGIKSLEKFINPYEAMRDPILSAKINNERGAKTELIVFIMRLIKSDFKNLAKRIYRRFDKLEYCTEFLSPKKKLAYVDIQTIGDFTNYLKKNIVDEEFHFVINYLKAKLQFDSLDDYEELELIWELDWDNLKNLENANSLTKEILLENIKWEIWGLYTQLPFLEDYNMTLQHVLVLKSVYESIDEENNASINAGFDYILEKLNSYLN